VLPTPRLATLLPVFQNPAT